MKAGEMLRRLTLNPFHEEYKGIYTHLNGTLVPLTTAKPDKGNLVFFRQNRKAPMSSKTLLAILHLHQNKDVYYWNNRKIAVFSFKVDHGKIVV